MQKKLLLRGKKKDVSDEVVMRCRNFTEALRLCASTSGLHDNQIAPELDIETSNFSQMLNSHVNRNFPPDKIPKLMEVCQNLIPLRWLALQVNHEVRPTMDAKDMRIVELEEALEDQTRKFEAVVDFIKKTGIKVKQ